MCGDENDRLQSLVSGGPFTIYNSHEMHIIQCVHMVVFTFGEVEAESLMWALHAELFSDQFALFVYTEAINTNISTDKSSTICGWGIEGHEKLWHFPPFLPLTRSLYAVIGYSRFHMWDKQGVELSTGPCGVIFLKKIQITPNRTNFLTASNQTDLTFKSNSNRTEFCGVFPVWFCDFKK